VSTTSENLLEFLMLPGNTRILLEFNWSSWKFLTDGVTAKEFTTTTILRPFFRDHPGEPVPEEDFWTLWYKGRLTEADVDHLAGCHSIWTNQCPPPPSPKGIQS